MKIKFEIDMQDLIDDALCDSEGEGFDINEELASNIKNSVIRQLLPKIKESVDKKVLEKVDSVISARIDTAVDNAISKAVDKGVVNLYGGGDITIINHVQDMFSKNTGWNSIGKQIERITKEFSIDLKTQYEAAFATKIVSNMKEQGLLKDDVVKILLDGKENV